MRKVLLLTAIVSFMMAFNPCWAEIPRTINYQGMLTDDQGQPLSGDYKFEFFIYGVPTGGTPLWSEFQLGIPVEDGLFNVMLGEFKPIPDSVFDEPERFLGIRVGTAPELSPRIQLTSVAYAYRANRADFAGEAGTAETDNDWTITGNNMHSALSGNVGIGTGSPTEKLDVNGTARLRGMALGTDHTPVEVDANGVLWKGNSSSRRYKTNIRNIQIDPEQILELQAVRFQWKTTGEEDIGLIAEEVEKTVPDLVLYDGEGSPEGVRYDKVAIYLLEVVKAQQENLHAVKVENQELKKRIEALESTE